MKSITKIAAIALILALSPIFASHAAPKSQPSASVPQAVRVSPFMTKFQVVSTLPAKNSFDYHNSYVTAIFSKPVDAASINGNTFKVKCDGKSITNANVQALDPNASNNKAAMFWANTFFPKNAQCVATVTTGVKSAQNESLAANYEWTFSTEPRDECQLEGCKDFYDQILALANMPNIPKHSFLAPNSIANMVVMGSRTATFPVKWSPPCCRAIRC